MYIEKCKYSCNPTSGLAYLLSCMRSIREKGYRRLPESGMARRTCTSEDQLSDKAEDIPSHINNPDIYKISTSLQQRHPRKQLRPSILDRHIASFTMSHIKALPPPPLKLPTSLSVVTLQALDTTLQLYVKPVNFLNPVIPGHEIYNCPTMAFLVTAPTTGRQILLDAPTKASN